MDYMNTYLLLKWIHIVSSVLLVGVGFGSAFYLFFVNRSRNVAAIAEVSRLVVRADYWFTTPAIFIQPITGFAMVSISGIAWTEAWLLATYALFLLAGACWLPVVRLQIQMAGLARAAADGHDDLPPDYWRLARLWRQLGTIAFPAMLVVYGLMVFRPSA
jgi:uncharacterized membrane protein